MTELTAAYVLMMVTMPLMVLIAAFGRSEVIGTILKVYFAVIVVVNFGFAAFMVWRMLG